MLSVLPFAGQAHESLRVDRQQGELRFALEAAGFCQLVLGVDDRLTV